MHIANGALIFLGAFSAVFFLGPMSPFCRSLDHAFRHAFIFDLGIPALKVMATVLFFSIIVPLFIGLPGIIAGCGLYWKKNWGRILAFVVGIVILLEFPFGTALGIYTLWVLMKPETAQLMTS